MDELDKFIEKYTEGFHKGRKKKMNPKYKSITNRLSECRCEGKAVWQELGREERKERSKVLKEKLKIQKSMTPTVPIDTNYKRIQYTRYADDFLVGVIGSKEDAETIKSDIKDP